MPVHKPATIKEIAKAIALGHTCYLSRKSSKIITIDHSIEDPEEVAAQEKTVAALELIIDKYVKIEKLSVEDKMIIRKDFIEELPDKSVRKELSNALNRKNPTRNFNRVIESDMELEQHWINFNGKEYQRWVSNFIIDAYNY